MAAQSFQPLRFLKRFTETNKWRDPWWRKLSSPAKQLQGYLWDNCDIIGLIDIDLGLVSADCGQEIAISHMAELGDRVQSIADWRFFLPKFIHFQYGDLTPTCPPHRPIIRMVEHHKLVRVGLHYCYPNNIEIIGVSYPNARVALPIRQDKTRQEQERTGQEGIAKGEVMRIFKEGICGLFENRRMDKSWVHSEESALFEVCKRPDCLEELADLRNYQRSNGQYFPKSVNSLLNDWDKWLDNAASHTRDNQRSKPKTIASREIEAIEKAIEKL